MFDVITVGSAAIDLFVNTADRLFIGRNKLTVPFGSKIIVKDFMFFIGGGGTNTAVAFSRLGLKTAYIGNIGDRTNNRQILELLKKEKVNTSLVVTSQLKTGYSIILDAEGHERTILVYKGSNDQLAYKDINERKLKTRWFYFSSMMGKSFETQKKLAEFAERNRIKIIFNPSAYLARKGIGVIKPILKRCEILVLNREEANLLVHKTSYGELTKELYKLGPKIVVITDGANGVHAFDGNKVYFIQAHKVKVVEATGAGDAFASGFLAGMIKKNDIEFALQLGLAEAESVLKYYGAKNRLLKWDEAMDIIKRNPGKIIL